MKKFVLAIVLLFCFLFFMGNSPRAVHAESTVTIGTGGVTGVFYQAGGAIARIVNKKRHEYGIRCVVESTDGSVYNIDAVISGILDFGLAQGDRQHQAAFGGAEWEGRGPQRDLRSMFSLYAEACTLVAAVDSGINTIADLRGKRVNLGHPGSGHRQNSIDALNAAGIDYKKDIIAKELKPLEASRLLKAGGIDAFFYTVGHPTGAIIDATSGKKKVKIIPMPVIAKKLVNDVHPYYVKTKIPIKYYRNAANDADIETFGVKATLVTSVKASNMLAYAIAKEIFENMRQFKSLHVAFQGLDKTKMLENMSARIHPGAMRYYKEAGLK